VVLCHSVRFGATSSLPASQRRFIPSVTGPGRFKVPRSSTPRDDLDGCLSRPSSTTCRDRSGQAGGPLLARGMVCSTLTRERDLQPFSALGFGLRRFVVSRLELIESGAGLLIGDGGLGAVVPCFRRGHRRPVWVRPQKDDSRAMVLLRRPGDTELAQDRPVTPCRSTSSPGFDRSQMLPVSRQA